MTKMRVLLGIRRHKLGTALPYVLAVGGRKIGLAGPKPQPVPGTRSNPHLCFGHERLGFVFDAQLGFPIQG